MNLDQILNQIDVQFGRKKGNKMKNLSKEERLELFEVFIKSGMTCVCDDFTDDELKDHAGSEEFPHDEHTICKNQS